MGVGTQATSSGSGILGQPWKTHTSLSAQLRPGGGLGWVGSHCRMAWFRCWQRHRDRSRVPVAATNQLATSPNHRWDWPSPGVSWRATRQCRALAWHQREPLQPSERSRRSGCHTEADVVLGTPTSPFERVGNWGRKAGQPHQQLNGGEAVEAAHIGVGPVATERGSGGRNVVCRSGHAATVVAVLDAALTVRQESTSGWRCLAIRGE